MELCIRLFIIFLIACLTSLLITAKNNIKLENIMV